MQDTGPGNGKNAGWYEAGMPRVLAQLLPLGRLPGALARGFARLGALARGFARLGALAGFLFENCLGLWLD